MSALVDAIVLLGMLELAVALVLTAGMWTVGLLTWMAATHGPGNALGFALCSLPAWRRILAEAPEPTGGRTA
ncbi:hypothetical protein OG402_36170 [Streptomyces anulatus]|nr:hypothetical protein [Streptomyces anulatus]MCX4522887.1 hypothetical protein [Streptomyces anulatus]MCX4605898.1 hypothetical protein [Streptomyces anulatus]